jgi:hypothetical protein
MNHFAAYFDILGTKDLVSRGEFSDLHALDFSGAVFVAAHQHPNSRFAAFSDCVIVTTPSNAPNEFLDVLQLLCGNWMSDGILVRGGIALGDVKWVDYDHVDRLISQHNNLRCARVYGTALNEAVEIERSSGPGILAFASDVAAECIRKIEPESVLALSSNIIRHFEWQGLDTWIGYVETFIQYEKKGERLRHLNATNRALNLFKKNNPLKTKQVK